MLTNEQITQLQTMLKKDIKQYDLQGDDIDEQIYLYMENIAGVELMDEQLLLKTVLTIKKYLDC